MSYFYYHLQLLAIRQQGSRLVFGVVVVAGVPRLLLGQGLLAGDVLFFILVKLGCHQLALSVLSSLFRVQSFHMDSVPC